MSATALVVCAPAVAFTTVGCACTLVDVMLDVDDVCTLTSRLVAAHLVASLEALTAVAAARLPTFGLSTLFGTGEDRVHVLACVTRLSSALGRLASELSGMKVIAKCSSSTAFCSSVRFQDFMLLLFFLRRLVVEDTL